MSSHLNLSTGKFLNSSTLFKLSDALLLDVSSGEIVMSNLLVPRVGADLFKLASLDLNFAQRKSLTDRVSGNNLVTFSRASIGTYVGADGLIKTSPVNLLTYSEEFNQSAWQRIRATISQNTILAPDGTFTADTLIPDTFTNSDGYARQYYSVSNSFVYSFSVFVKQRDSYFDYIKLTAAYGGAGTLKCWFNISAGNGAKGTVDSGATATIEEYPNGWYRCTLTSTASAAGSIPFIITPARADNISIFDGDSTQGIYIWGAQLEEGSTASTYIPTTTTKSGAPRFDHDPVTGESLGLLIEEARTNLAKYSEPDNRSANNVASEWSFADLNQNTEITKVEGPDGISNSASEMQLATGNSWDAYLHQVPVTSGASYTFSAWVKLGTATNFALHVNDTASWDSVPDGRYSFDVNDGLNTNTFVKVSHTFTTPSGGKVNVHIGRHLGTAPVQQTQGTVTVWGCQLEPAAFSSSTIITSGSAVTRAADVASITGTNFSSWYNQSEGTWFGEVKKSYPTTQRLLEVGDSSNNQYSVSIRPGVTSTFFARTSSGSSSVNTTYPAKFACADSVTDIRGCVNGTLSTLITSGSSPTDDTLVIGGVMSATASTNAISRLAYFPTRKTDQELIDLTT